MTTFDPTTTLTAGMSELVDQVVAIVGAIAPGAITIVGTVLAIRLAIGVFRSLVRA